ncbi:unnamed protein product [Cladocopium goreaui]|uniref:Pentatricopeptide repeat-containing protein, chloroplastic n=1 Tax=Cladocopium goreaui TaxID=2562237 RepID=A0A9P1DVF7_9DINO|nr:unnamed protein product [Cladocopium goreaui]|mmetsp:Transcript_69974/g.154288  ORF Transcript_69974/g.154288 Transcript_69974/m.154288 type:complete len:166 (+) Transcript_69974:49-546(+)
MTEEGQCFTAVISRTPSSNLGVDVTYRSWTGDGVFITKVFEDGLVADWNSKNDPFKHICAGDFIFQVNSVSGDTVAMIKELKFKTELTIHIRKRCGQEIPPMTPPPKAPEAARETARNRVVKPQLEAILSEMNAISDEELAGLICVAMERRPWLLPSVLGNNGDA